MKLEFSRQIFEKVLYIKISKNLSSRSRVVPCRLTDMTKLIVAFRNFSNAPTSCSTFNWRHPPYYSDNPVEPCSAVTRLESWHNQRLFRAGFSVALTAVSPGTFRHNILAYVNRRHSKYCSICYSSHHSMLSGLIHWQRRQMNKITSTVVVGGYEQ
jgi:hypothetical protein